MKLKRSETRHLGLYGETPTVWQELECVTLVISHPSNDRNHTHAHTPQSHVTIGIAASLRTRGSTGACWGDRYVPHLTKLCVIHTTLLLSTLIDSRCTTQIQFCSPDGCLFYLVMTWFFLGVEELTWLTQKSIVNEDIMMDQWNIYGIYRHIHRKSNKSNY